MNTTSKILLSVILTGFITFGAMAQPETGLKSMCATGVPDAQWETEFQTLVKAITAERSVNKTQAAAYTIPVIIHVIHGGQPVGTYPNLAQGQLNSQILVLNSDYAGAGYNSGNYPLAAYANWAATQVLSPASLDPNGRVTIADCGVQFCLATKDSLGNILPEPGIDRINYVTRGWANPFSFSNINNFRTFIDGTVKPQTIWNVSKYLNIWVTDSDVGNVNLLGYATFPPLANITGITTLGPSFIGTNTSDGFWCYSKCFGSASTFPGGTYYTGYTRGRTSTHEIGHWLGLRHIWGDGNCNATDYCSDTPPASASNFGTPAYPFKTAVCAGNSPDGEMFMNFMDYTDDNAKYMFTTDQSIRIQTAMTNSPYRALLGTHNLCTVSEVAVQASFSNLLVGCTGVGIPLNNTSNGFPPPSYTWSSSGGTFTPGNTVTSPLVKFSSPGTYTIYLSADNGTLSTISRTITISSPPIALLANPQTICAGSSVTLSASGVSTYTWEPGGITGFEFVDTPQQSQTYTCNGTQVNGCTTSGTFALVVDICTGINSWNQADLVFSVYPNPAKDNLSVTMSRTGEATAEVTDALGKLVLSGQLIFSRDKREQQLNVSTLPNGVYFIRLSAKDSRAQFARFIKE